MFMISETKGMDVVSGSASAMLALLDTANIPTQNQTRHADAKQNYGTSKGISFGGLTDTTQAAEIFRSAGWQEGAERARREIPTLNLSDLTPEATNMKRRRAFSAEGDTLRVDSALSGKWETAWETRERKQSRQPVTLSVGCAFGGNGVVAHEQMFWNGLQMAAICDLLEGAGWRVELRALKANSFTSSQTHCQDWRVKDADQPLRIDTTLALFGHAGVYRCFGWLANTASVFKAPYNYGHVLDGRDMVEAFDTLSGAGLIPPLSLIIPPAFDRSAAVHNLRTALATLKQRQ